MYFTAHNKHWDRIDHFRIEDFPRFVQGTPWRAAQHYNNLGNPIYNSWSQFGNYDKFYWPVGIQSKIEASLLCVFFFGNWFSEWSEVKLRKAIAWLENA